MERRTACVAGGTGLVGGNLLRLLLEDPAYERVTALVRKPSPLTQPRLVQATVDFDRLEDSAKLDGSEDVFCCLGTTIRKAGSQEAFRKVDFDYPLRLARLASAAGAKRFLLVTSLGADRDSMVFYSRVKGEVEQAVAKERFEALHIFRPSVLAGDRGESRPGERVAIALMKGLSFLLLGPLRKYRAIEAAVVAKAMVLAARSGTPGVTIHESDEIQALADGTPL